MYTSSKNLGPQNNIHLATQVQHGPEQFHEREDKQIVQATSYSKTTASNCFLWKVLEGTILSTNLQIYKPPKIV